MSLTNQDFRRLMMTPRPDASSNATGGGGRRPLTEDELQERARKKQDRSAYYIRLQQQKQLRDKSTQYNDRAAQRRKKEREDRRDAAGGQVGGSSSVVAASGDDPADVDTTNMTAEQTKLLGGDIEHTHLVKGLDYALLEKRRMEIDMETANAASAKQSSSDAEPENDEIGEFRPVSELAKRIHRMFETVPGDDNNNDSNVSGQEGLGQAKSGSSIFMKNRVIYRYSFDVDDTTPVPVTVLMSKKDAGGNSNADVSNYEADARTNKLILSKISSIMKLKDALKKKHRDDAVDLRFDKNEESDKKEDIEIFSGVGKYDLPMLDKGGKEKDTDVFMVPSNGGFAPMKVFENDSFLCVRHNSLRISSNTKDENVDKTKEQQQQQQQQQQHCVGEVLKKGSIKGTAMVTEEQYKRIRDAQKAAADKRDARHNLPYNKDQRPNYDIDPAMKKYFSRGDSKSGGGGGGSSEDRSRARTDDLTVDGVVDDYAVYYPGDDELSFSQIKSKM